MKRIFTQLTVLLFVAKILNGQLQPPTVEWQKTIGGSLKEEGRSVQQTADGGYILTAYTNSNDRDVSGNHGSGSDVWVIKLNASGNIQWQKCFGGTATDEGWCIRQTTDGAYILAGMASSTNGDVTGSHGNNEFWIVKLNASGNIIWQKTLGGTDYDVATWIEQTTDAGYIVTGYTHSNNGDVNGNHGDWDYWVVKLDATGNIQWQKTLGGNGTDEGFEIRQATDGGYIVTGREQSTNSGNVTGAHGYYDAWVIKLDAGGNIQWQKPLGGSAYDVAFSIEQATDGGYIAAGSTVSTNGNVSGNHGAEDAWVVKLDALGNIQWQRTYGGTDVDLFSSIRKTSDGGYVASGYTASHDGDVSGVTEGWDMWVVKLDASGNIQWQKTLGGNGDEEAWDAQQTADGGYIIAGSNNVFAANAGDVFVVKLKASGGITLASTWYNFTAKYENENAVLDWEILTDRPGGYFELQRSTNGTDFTTIAIVMETEASFVTTGYKYTDRNVSNLQKEILYYRIRYIDAEGITSLSTVATIRFFNAKNNAVSVWPNPGQGVFHIRLPNRPAHKINLTIYNTNGQPVKQEYFQSQQYTIDLSNHAKGIYFIVLDDGYDFTQFDRIVLQ